MRSSCCILALLVLIACEAGPPAPAGEANSRAPAESTMIPVAPRTGSATRDSLPRRIYYDLARFDWYARGEPVQWQDQLWEPAGGPVAFVTQDLRLLGEFEGVDLWTLADADTIATLYVPVSEGFWLPFRPALEGS